MRELFELIAEHPFVALFLAYCTGWTITTIIEATKKCECEGEGEYDEEA
jgi:hypothetical protein